MDYIGNLNVDPNPESLENSMCRQRPLEFLSEVLSNFVDYFWEDRLDIGILPPGCKS